MVGISYSTTMLWVLAFLFMLLLQRHQEGVQSFQLTQQSLQSQYIPRNHHQSVTVSSLFSSRISTTVLYEQRKTSNRHNVGMFSDNNNNNNSNNDIVRSIRKTTVSLLLSLSIISGGILSGNIDPSMVANAASDPSAIVGCLFEKCSIQLGKCIASPMCLANVVCINTCNNRPDEIECQIKCGDIFDNPAIAEFNKCAVSDMSCVPQQQDTGMYPVPSRDVTVPKFNTNFFNGRLYITAGTSHIERTAHMTLLSCA